MLRSTLRIPRTKCCADVDSSQTNNERNSLDKIYYKEQILESYLDQISLSDAPKLSSLMLSLILENGWYVSIPLKVFCTKSRGEILIRGEGYNNSGVYH